MPTCRCEKFPWAAAFILLALAVILALSFTPSLLGGPEAAGLMMFYWLACGVPLAAVSLAAWAGAAAGRAEPFSKPLRLISVSVASLLGATALALAAWALIDFTPPEKVYWWSSAGDLFAAYALGFVYLSLYSFVLSYAFRSALAGAALAAAGFASVIFPFICISIFQNLFTGLVPLAPLEAATAFITAACAGTVLKLLSDKAAGREHPAARPRSLFLLLLLPTLVSLGSLAALDIKAGKVAMSAKCSLYLTELVDQNPLGDAMLVQKPFSGEIFLIDGSGRRAEVAGGEQYAGFPLRSMRNIDAMAARGKDGNLWLLYAPSTSTARLAGGGIGGFSERAVIKYPDDSPIFLLGGKEPGLVMSRYNDGDYFAPLPYDGKGLEWKKICSEGPGCDHVSKKLEEETPSAFFSGDTLSHGKDKWVLPGSEKPGKNRPVKGFLLRDRPAFLVEAEIKGGPFTYFCRSGAKPQLIWPGYRPGYRGPRLMTSHGALWTKTARLRGADSGLHFLILDEAGKGLPPFKLPDDVIAGTGVNINKIILLKAAGGSVWFNAGGKYLLKADAAGPGKAEMWRLPPIAERPIFILGLGGSPRDEDYYNAVTPVSGGIIVAALDGVYFMDWAGNLKKIY